MSRENSRLYDNGISRDEEPGEHRDKTVVNWSGSGSERSDSFDGSDEFMEEFDEVMKIVRLDLVPAFAIKTRCEITVTQCHMLHSYHWFGRVKVDSPPLHGSFNILFPIDFGDGVRWLLKVSSNGTKKDFDVDAAQCLHTEATVMRILKQGTTIPVPKVYAFDVGFEKLGCPFTIMQYVPGKSLFDVWFNRHLPRSDLEAKRIRALDGMAAAMVQLSTWTFSTGGSLLFDSQGKVQGIVASQYSDILAELRNHAAQNEEDTVFTLGPFDRPCAYFQDHVQRRLDKEKLSDLQVGMLRFLLLLFEWLPETEDQAPFVLQHPDFNHQNCLVSEDGELQAIIDWDGVDVVPKVVGDLRHPSFLTRDWDPGMYGYENGEEDGQVKKSTCPEDSPQTLHYFRSVYANVISSHLERREMLEESTPCSSRTTRRSLIWENLYIAATSPVNTAEILEKVFREILAVIDEDNELVWNTDEFSESENSQSHSIDRFILRGSDQSKSAIMEAQREGDKQSLELVGRDDAQLWTGQGDLIGEKDHVASEGSDSESRLIDSMFFDFVTDLAKTKAHQRQIGALREGFEKLLDQI